MKKSFCIVYNAEPIIDEFTSIINKHHRALIVTAKDNFTFNQKINNQSFDVVLYDWDLQENEPTKLIMDASETQKVIIIHTNNHQRVNELFLKVKNVQVLPKPIDYEKISNAIEKNNFNFGQSFNINQDVIAPLTLNIQNNLKNIQPDYQFRILPIINVTDPESMPDADLCSVLEIKSKLFNCKIALLIHNDVFEEFFMNDDDIDPIILNTILTKSVNDIKKRLELKSIKINIGQVDLIFGHGNQNCQYTKSSNLLIPLNTDAGKIYCQICLQTS